jgi:hypothetical protein
MHETAPLSLAALLVSCLLAACGGGSATEPTMALAHGSDAESETAEVLRALHRDHDLSAWTVTDRLVIDEQAVPHSHPVLTLHARDRARPELVLSTYLHEQLHWLLDAQPERTEAALAAIVERFPEVPSQPPEGARNEASTRLHLVVCHLEHRSLVALLGREPADAVMAHWATHHYRWVYRTVLAKEDELASVVRRAGFTLPEPIASFAEP